MAGEGRCRLSRAVAGNPRAIVSSLSRWACSENAAGLLALATFGDTLKRSVVAPARTRLLTVGELC